MKSQQLHARYINHFWIKVALSALMSTTSVLASQSAVAAAPVIQAIEDQSITLGHQLVVPVGLTNKQEAGPVNWSKAFGPDGVSVNALTGAVLWAVPEDMPSESFHIGVRASNADGAAIDTFIVHAGVTQVIYIGPDEKIKSFAQAFNPYESPGTELRDPGTTFVVRNGHYSGVDWNIGLTPRGANQNLPAGTPQQYTTVMAQDPGQVVLSDNAQLWGKGVMGGVAYWAIKGFFLEGGYIGVDGSNCNDDPECQPHHVKFIRNGLNNHATRSFFGSTQSNHILFENNYSYGGQRVKFLAYKTTKSVFRRNVARFDHNEVNEGPRNTFAFYTSMDIEAQNNIAIDADHREFISTGEMAGEFGCPTTAGPSRAVWDRNIQLNSDMLHANLDRQSGSCYATINDVIGWDNRSAHSFVMTRSPSFFNHATFGEIHLSEPMVVFNGWPGDAARGLTNSIIHNVTDGDLFEGFQIGSTSDADGQKMARYGIDTLNLTGFDGNLIARNVSFNQKTVTYHNPIWSASNPQGGLRYLVRIEANSNLSGKAPDGGDLGATVMTLKGQSGTMWGEPGYDSETHQQAWPFPFQETIAEKMRSMRHTGPTWIGDWTNRTNGPQATLSGDRGFAQADTNLTDYIWGYLGSTVPPMNVNATGTTKAAKISWDKPADRAKIAYYTVYDYDPQNRTIANPRKAGNKNNLTINNLINQKTYYFAVTATSEETGESSWSYPVEVVPQHRPKPLAPRIIGAQYN